MTTHASPRSGDGEKVKVIIEDHPIKILAVSFSKIMHDLYKPMFNLLMEAFNDLNERMLS